MYLWRIPRLACMWIKDHLKNIAHHSSLIPYRKSCKRYQFWDYRRENNFLSVINEVYSHNQDKFDSILVSVIMPVFNRAEFIPEAIKSVIRQTHCNWELILVDDGSTDYLTDALAPFYSNPRIRLFAKTHGGQSSARNFGLSKARGKYLAYLDTDNTYSPAFLRNMIAFMEAGNLDNSYSGLSIFTDGSKQLGYLGEDFDWKSCYELNFIDINSFVHGRWVLDQGHRFDETISRLVDWDFILSATVNNRTVFAPFLGVFYYDGKKGNRVTRKTHVGRDIKKLKCLIQSKHKFISQSEEYSHVGKLDWRMALDEYIDTAKKK